MKRLVMAIALCLVCAMSFGQLNAKTVEESAGYKTVYKIPMGHGEIRLLNDSSFVYFGVTDNKFESTMASIYLGHDKESAIKSLQDLQSIQENGTKETLVVKGNGDKETKIFKVPLQGIGFETEYVAGISWAISMTNFDKAIKAVQDF